MTSRGILWQGFNYQWKRVPHRLSILGSHFNNLLVNDHSLSAYHDKHLKIGNFPKGEADYQVGYCALQLGGVFYAMGRSEILHIETPYQVAFEQSFNIEIDLSKTISHSEIVLEQHPKIKVV